MPTLSSTGISSCNDNNFSSTPLIFGPFDDQNSRGYQEQNERLIKKWTQHSALFCLRSLDVHVCATYHPDIHFGPQFVMVRTVLLNFQTCTLSFPRSY